MPSRSEGLASIFRNSSYLAVGHIGSVIVRLLYLMILVRFLSPAEYGNLSFGMAWYLTLIVFTYLGHDVILGRGIGRGEQHTEDLLDRTLLQRSIAIGVVSLVSVVAATASDLGKGMLSVLVAFTFAIAGRSLWVWSAWCFTAFGKAKHAILIDLIFRPIEIWCVLAFFLFGERSILGVAAIHAAIWCVQGLLGTALARKAPPRYAQRDVNDKASLLRDGAAGTIYAVGLAWFLQAPVLLFGYFGEAGPVFGHFALAFQLIGHLQVIPYLVGTAALPVLSRSAVRKDGKDRMLALAMLVTVPAAGGILVALAVMVAPPLVIALFGDAYTATATVLIVGLWLLIPLSLAVLMQQFTFAATQRPLLGILAPLAGVVVMALLFGPMTVEQGYIGAIVATGVGMAVWAGIALYSLLRMGFFKPRSVA